MEKASSRSKGSHPELEALEGQVLYSADALGGLDAVLFADRDDTVVEASLLGSAADETDAQRAAVSAEHAETSRHEVVFVDTDTPDYQQLVDDLTRQSGEDRQFDIFILDNERDGIGQISEILAGYNGLDAVHIISHGSDGAIDLGGSRLDADALDINAGSIGAWANAFSESGDFLIYGCDLAASADGQQFIDSLASLTGADVAASDDLTGGAGLGGDWDLEYATGSVEADVALSAPLQSRFEAVLTDATSIQATFQQGVNGYAGTQDTYTDEDLPATSQGNQASISVDLDGGDSGGLLQGLIRFDALFGSGPGQIPFGSTINSASLTLNASNASQVGAQVALHQMLTSWSEASTWNSTGSGVQTDGVEAAAAFDSVLANPEALGSQTFLGLESTLQAWSEGAANHGWVIVQNSTNGIDFSSSEDGIVAVRPMLTVDYTPPDTVGLWMTTEEDVASPSGANGLDSWSGGSILSFDNPNLAYAPGVTDGTLSNVLNLDLFVQDGDARLDAIHYVGSNMTVGSNAVPLQAGDILLSSVFPETLVNSDTSTLSVSSRDVFIFRPDSLADYSLGGTFIKLIDGVDLAVEIEGITLVEQTTTIGFGAGATTLNAGDFLFTDRNNNSDIFRLQSGVLGDAATNTGTITTLVNGSSIGISGNIHGVELVESDVVVGDRALTSGQLLISLYADDVVAGTSVSSADIFVLDVSDTGPTTTATATPFFVGGDIGFDTWQESPWAVSLVPAANEAPIANADDSYLVFDGNDIVRIANDPALQVTNTLTMEARFNLDASATGSHIILNKEGEYEVGINADTGELRFAIAQTANTWAWHDTGYFVAPGEWTHVAVTYDGVAGEARTYVNGELVDTFAQSGTVGDAYPGFNDLTIGGRENDADERFLGRIDDVRIWNTARSSAEINANYNDVLTGSESGLAGYWRLDGVVGTQVSDLTGNNNDGVLGGAEGAASAPVYDGYLTDQDSSLVVAAGQGVLANDTDQDGDTLSVTNLDTSGMLGNLVMNTGDGSFTYDPNGAFDYLREGEVAYDTFSYSANDGTMDSNIVTVTIAITGTEDAPTAASNTVTTNEDTAYIFSAADFNFSDVDGDTLASVQITSLETAGSLQLSGVDVTLNQVISIADIDAGNLVFVPAADGNGLAYDAFEFRVSDGTSPGATGTVLNSFPAASVNSMSSLAFDGTSLWLTSPNDDTIYNYDTAGNLVSSFAAPGTFPTGITFDGTNLWVVDRDDNTVYEIDTLGNVQSSFATPGTDSRGLTWDGSSLWLVEGTGSLVYELSTTGSVLSSFGWPDDFLRDITWDGSSLWVADQNDQQIIALNTSGAVLSSFATPSTGATGLTFDGTEFWHADADTDTIYQLAGQSSIVYSEDAYVMTIDVTAVDDAAVITGNTSYMGDEGDVVAGDLDATDVEGLTDSTYFTVSTAATNGTAAIDAETGAWSFTPTDPNWFGTDNFTVTVTDDLGGTTTQVVSITLANVDDAAVVTGDVSFSGNEGDAVFGDLDATDVEGLTDGTVFSVTSPAANGTASIDPATGAWTFTPTDSNWFGTDNFTITVTDDLGGTTTQVVSITLANVDDPAVITGDVSFSGNEGDTVFGDLDATDVEGLTDGTVFSVTSPAANGTASIDPATGAWTFTPTDSNWFGTDNFTVTVTDDLGGTTTQVVSITLANVDDAAVVTGDVSFSGNEGDVVSGDLDATDVEGLTDGTVFSVTSPAATGTASIDPDTGAWTFTPTDSNWFGTDNFTVTVTDDLGGTTTQVVSITLANVDDPAVITGDLSFSGNEGDAVGGDLDATDIEGLTDGTLFSVTSPAANGTASIDPATGAWSFTPTDGNWFGTDNFTVTVTDDLGGTTTQVVSITLANVDDAAVITGDVSFSGNEGDAVFGDLDATDVEGLTDGTVFSITSPAANGTASIDPATGAWTFTPTDSNWFGTDNFTVTVTDDLGGTTTQVVSITLANVDDAAVITGDVSFTGNEGDTVFGDLDATDVEGLTDGTVFSVTSPAANGTASIDPATGAWTFTPTDSNWFGTDNFTVTVTDDLGGTTTQVVSITLANVDDAAVITGDVSFTGNEGDAVFGDLDATDVEGLTDGTLFSVTSPAANGTASIDPATGAWSFTPTDGNWFGTDNFTVTVTDDLGGTTTQVVSITLANVDDAAVITGDVSFSGNEGDAVFGDLDATDVEGLTDGTVFSVTSPAANGTASIDPATGAWTFTPTDSNWFGTDNFTVTVTDDLGGTTTQVVSITLANVDDPAVITGDVSFSGNEGDAVFGDLDATDVEGLTDGTVFSVTSPAANGTASIDPATGAWTFTPTDSNWFGTDNFTVTVTDDLGGTTTQVVSITLANVDDAAVVTGDVSFSGNEGDAVFGDLDATDVEGLTDGTVFSVTSPAANGTASIDPATGAWSFTPTDSNWFGTDNFTVTVTDDLGGTTTQVVGISLANVDDSAVITGDVSFSGNEGDAVVGDLNATDVDGLTDGTLFSVTSPAANGTASIDPATGAWSFTPTDSNWFGTDNFTVTVTDDLGGTMTQVVSITLANVDDAAVVTGDVSFSGNEGDAVLGDLDATDVEGLTDGTLFSVTSPAANGTASIDPATGAWTFTPTDSNWFGTDNFTVTVTDDLGGTTTQVVSITLANVDDSAVITGDVSFSGNEGDAVFGDLDATDVEGLTDGTLFSVTSPAANGTASIDPATGAWSFTPTDSNWFGTDNFTVTVTDDLGGTTTQVVSISLANVDDSAVITGDVSFSGNEGDAVVGDLNATDVDGLTDGTLFSVTSPAANGTASIDPATGAWSFTPTDSNWFGTDNFTVTVTDDLGGTMTQVVSITLANVDDPAVITGDVSFSGNEGDAVLGDLDATDVEGLTDGTLFSVTSPAANGTASIDPATGAWSFTPTDSNWFGTDNFTVTVTDDLGGATTQVVSITLANVDDSAVIIGDVSFSGNEGDAVFGDLNATDVEGLTDGTVFSVTSPATNGTASIDPATGAWTFTPTDSNWFGRDRFVVTVTDDLGGTTTQVVSITAVNVDEAIVIGGTDRGTITEDTNVVDGRLRTGGRLTMENAPDGEAAFQVESVAGRFGTLNTEASGSWTYVADNNAAVIQALDAGETVVENLTVSTADGTSHEILVTINGAEDAPVITASSANALIAGNTVSSQGVLSIQDPDAADNPVGFRDIEPTLSDNGYGQFQMRAGTWTYSLNSGSAAVQLLQSGQTLQDSFEFVAGDGSSKLVTVTIFGAPDAQAAAGTPAEVPGQEASPDDFEWLSDIVAVAENSAEPGESSLESDAETPVEEAGETPGEVDVNPNPFPPPLFPAETTAFTQGESASFTQPERRDGFRVTIPLEDLAPLILQQEVLESEQASGFESPVEITATEKEANTDALRKAMNTMREEIAEAAEDSQSTKQMVEMGLRVSGTALSTGSLAWLLRSASLFASALSSVPTWKSFDPLPVLARKKQQKEDQDPSGNPKKPAEDKAEAAVGRMLDGADTQDERIAAATSKGNSK